MPVISAALAFGHGVHGHVAEGGGDELVGEVGIAGAEIVGEVADDGLFLGAGLDLGCEVVADVGLLLVAVGVGFAVVADLVAFPLGAFAEDDERVVRGVGALVVDQEFDQLVEVHLVLGDDAADGGDVGGVEGRVAGIAAEDAEDADALVGADGGALALDGAFGAGDGGGEADAVFGVLHVVIHRLGDGDDLDAFLVEACGVAEGVVAADGDNVVGAEGFEVLEDRVVTS
jgi:hypothetical protein